MNSKYDAGPIFAQIHTPMPKNTSPDHLLPLFNRIYTKLPTTLKRILAGDKGTPQSDQDATYADFFDSSYSEIDWSHSRSEIDRQVRAWQWIPSFSKVKGPFATAKGKRIRVLEVVLEKPTAKTAIKMRTADGPIWITSSE